MKRCARRSPDSRGACQRRGTIFHYYLVYMLLTSTLLTVAGVCIHTILKADHQDTQTSRQLHALLRLQQMLQQDAAEADSAIVKPGELVLKTVEETAVEWAIDGNIVHRRVTKNQEFDGADRFIFSAGTEARFLKSRQPQLLTLQLTDPPFVRRHAGSDSKAESTVPADDASRKLVEILVRLPIDGAAE